MTRARALTCNCCGDTAGTFKQWWNRDSGYGQCGKCSDWGLERGESLAHIRDMAGDAGVHRPTGPLEARLRADNTDADNLEGAALAMAVGAALDALAEPDKAREVRRRATRAFRANLKHAIGTGESVSIGGGTFGRDELRAVLATLEGGRA